MASKKVILKKPLDDEMHRINTIKNSQECRKNKKFPDAVLRTRDGTDVLIHRNIVAANSGYFLTLFENHPKDIIEMKDNISGRHLEMIMDYMYTGILQIRFEDAVTLNKYANKYFIKALENETTKILCNNINSETCLEYWRHAGNIAKFDLEQQCFNYILKNTEQFFLSSISELQFKEIEAIVNNPRNSCSKEILYKNIIKWIKIDFNDRQHYINDLLTNIDFSKFSDDFMNSEILNDKKLWESKDFIGITFNYIKLKLCSDEFKNNPKAQQLNMLFNNEDILKNDMENQNNQSILTNNIENLNLNDNQCQQTSNNSYSNVYDKQLKHKLNHNTNEYVAYATSNLKINNDKFLLITQNDLYDINFEINKFHKICKHNRRWNFAINSYKSNLLLLSGGGYWNGSNTCQFYNDSTKELYRFTSMREQRRWHRTININNNDQIYSCGGSSINGSVEICDINTEKWLNCESKMLDKNRNFGIATHGDCLYTFGGTINYSNSKTVEFFDPRDGKWIDLKMNLNSLEETRSICCYNSIFCFGTTFGQIFDVRQNRWRDTIIYPNDTKKLTNFDVVEMNNKFYIASASMLTQKLQIYDHQFNNWSMIFDNNTFHSTGELHFGKISSNEWKILK